MIIKPINVYTVFAAVFVRVGAVRWHYRLHNKVTVSLFSFWQLKPRITCSFNNR